MGKYMCKYTINLNFAFPFTHTDRKDEWFYNIFNRDAGFNPFRKSIDIFTGFYFYTKKISKVSFSANKK